MTIVDSIASTCPLSQWKGQDRHCRWCGEQIASARRRTWCSDKCRRIFERNHIWRRARSAARRRAKYTCEIQGCPADRGTLEVHHLEPRNGRGYGPGCHAHQENLQVLCKPHHDVETAKERASKQNQKRET